MKHYLFSPLLDAEGKQVVRSVNPQEYFLFDGNLYFWDRKYITGMKHPILILHEFDHDPLVEIESLKECVKEQSATISLMEGMEKVHKEEVERFEEFCTAKYKQTELERAGFREIEISLRARVKELEEALVRISSKASTGNLDHLDAPSMCADIAGIAQKVLKQEELK